MVMKVHEAAVVKGMLLRRQDRQQDIAAHFGVNAGRIAEIAKGRRFRDVKPIIDFDLLPEPTFNERLPTQKIRGSNRLNELNEIVRAAGRATKDIEELFSEKCRKYSPLSKEEGDRLFTAFQELGTHLFKLSQNISNYQRRQNND